MILTEKGRWRRQSPPSIACVMRFLTLPCGGGCTDSTCTETRRRFLPPWAEGPAQLGAASSAWGEAEPRQREAAASPHGPTPGVGSSEGGSLR